MNSQPTTTEDSMRAIIHPHKPTKYRPTQQWAAYDAQGRAWGYAHNLEKLTASRIEKGYDMTHSPWTYSPKETVWPRSTSSPGSRWPAPMPCYSPSPCAG